MAKPKRATKKAKPRPAPKRRVRPTTARERVAGAATAPAIIFNPDDIIAAADPIRLSFPQLDDDQIKLALLIVQTGWDKAKIAAATGWSRSWVYSTAMRADWNEYLNVVSIRALGWAASAGAAVLRELLAHKSAYIRLQAATELMERGGMRKEPVRAAALNVTFNVTNSAGSGAPQAEGPLIVIGMQGEDPDGTQPLPSGSEPALKNELAQRGGSLPHSKSGEAADLDHVVRVTDVWDEGGGDVG